MDYNDTKLAESITSDISSRPQSKVDHEAAAEKMRSAIRIGNYGNRLPLFNQDPDYVFAWVPDDVNMPDNVAARLSQGWTYVTTTDQPTMAPYARANMDPAVSRAKDGDDVIRVREVVALKLARGAHKVWMDTFHKDAPQVLEDSAIDSFKDKGPKGGSVELSETGSDTLFTRPEYQRVKV